MLTYVLSRLFPKLNNFTGVTKKPIQNIFIMQLLQFCINDQKHQVNDLT